MARYEVRIQEKWPNDPGAFLRDIKDYFVEGAYSVELVYHDSDGSLVMRIWEDTPYNLEDHQKIPD